MKNYYGRKSLVSGRNFVNGAHNALTNAKGDRYWIISDMVKRLSLFTVVVG